MKKFFILFFIQTSVSLFGQKVKYSNEFMNIGVGARSLAMANSSVSSSNDIYSGYWNPAGLVNLENNIQLSGMHAEYFAGIAKFDYGAFALKIDSVSTFSASLLRFGVDNIPNTTQLIDADGNINYDNITSFSAVDYGFLASYGRRLNPNLSVGANAKIIRRVVGDMAKSWGFGIDVSAQYKLKDYTFGVVLRDVTTTFNAWNYTLSDETKEVFELTGNEIPQNSLEITLPRAILGIARTYEIKEKFFVTPEINFDLTTDGKRNVLLSAKPFSIDPHFGVEGSFKKLVFLRAGVGNIQKELNDIGNRQITTFQPNIGLGIKFQKISVDYAYTDVGDQSIGLFSHIISLKIGIDKSK